MNKIIKLTFSFFFQGLLALLPLIVSAYIIFFFYGFVERILDGLFVFVPEEFRQTTQMIVIIKIMSFIVMFCLITLLGLFVKTVAGKLLLSLIDSFFMSIPGLRPVYRATRQVIHSFSSSKTSFFLNPVLVEYPSKGIWTIGFNTGVVPDEFNPEKEIKRFSIFIPTTPNPTSGFLMIVNNDQIRPLKMKTEKAMQFLLTGGVVKD
ncbi:MAG: DUF502 domain-containing protein [Candidatus Delongbacteria bacterium]|nr:DUF502 domain-containing protein [Candidatus Delongbacteria bacterium]